MNRLQKKCIIVTSSLHGLLIAVLLFGSALMPAHKDENNARLFTMVDLAKVNDGPSGGSEPNAGVPVALPAAGNPKPPVENIAPPAQPVVKPTPVVEPPVVKPPPSKEPEVKKVIQPELVEAPPKVIHPDIKNDLPKPHSVKTHDPKHKLTPEDLALAPTKPKNAHKPTIDPDSLRPVVRKPDEKAKAAKEAAAAAERDAERAAERAEREQRNRAAKMFASSIRNLGKGFSAKTLVQMPLNSGGGGGGEASFNYRDLIASRYYNAWVAPVALEDNTPAVMASVTISRSGDVINFHIIKRSGNSLMDKSIENVLETVKFIEPFPEGSHDQERTVTIQFNLQAKRQIG